MTGMEGMSRYCTMYIGRLGVGPGSETLGTKRVGYRGTRRALPCVECDREARCSQTALLMWAVD